MCYRHTYVFSNGIYVFFYTENETFDTIKAPNAGGFYPEDLPVAIVFDVNNGRFTFSTFGNLSAYESDFGGYCNHAYIIYYDEEGNENGINLYEANNETHIKVPYPFM